MKLVSFPGLASLGLLPLFSSGPGSGEAGDADFVERARAHYARVGIELESRTPEGLDATRRERRRLALEALAAYRERGDFGRDREHAGERVPLFVDEQGRRCAVANLMHAFGRDDLVARVAATRNMAFVADLAADAELRAWLDEVGLTLEEAARIQGPAISPPKPPDNPYAPAFGPMEGPAPVTPPRPSEGTRGAPPPQPTGGSTPGTGPGVVTPYDPLNPTTPDGGALQDFADWTWWWEYNKLEWLVPNRLAFRADAAEDGRTYAESAEEALRRELTARLEAGLSDGSAEVRAAAAIAYGRAAGPAAREKLTALLDDEHPDVRRSAVLALGACGSEEAVHALLRIAYQGSLDGHRELAAWVRPTAILALGLARRQGVGERTAELLPDPSKEEPRARLELSEALLANQTLAPSQELRGKNRGLAPVYDESGRRRIEHDEAVPTAMALEALRHEEPDEVLSLLLRSLGSRDIEERRSAAATLGTLSHPLVLQPLLTAFEMEKEPVTRGLLLIAIGRRGGDEARDFLIETLEHGPRSFRSWSALALGILAREAEDEIARAAIRSAYAQEANHEARSAYPIASGIARDAGAAEGMRHELLHAKSERTRMVAGLALALAGADGARDTLRAALERETSPLARTVIAQGLGLLGDARDATFLLGLLEEVQDPVAQVQLAVALAFHGSAAGARGLAEALAADDLAAPGRAAAIQALGILLSRAEPFGLADLTEDANYAILPAWLGAPLQSTL